MLAALVERHGFSIFLVESVNSVGEISRKGTPL